MFTATTLLIATFLLSTVSANVFSSGMFLVRISSEQQHKIRYCFTELPYSLRRSENSRCLKSGDLNIAKRTEKVIDLRLMNLSMSYLTIELTIDTGTQGPAKTVNQRIIVDGALPAKRIAVENGLVMDFVTICDRPWYGLMCSRYCIENADAHYVCDSRGEKVCLVGWTGKDCDIVTKNVFPSDVTTKATPTPTSSTASAIPSTGRLTTKKLGTTVGRTTSRTFQSITTKAKILTQTESTPKWHSSAVHPVESTTISSKEASTDSPIHSVSTSTINSQDEIKILTQSTSSPVKQDSNNSHIQDSLKLFLLMTTIIIALGYLFTVCARNSSIQNWINTRKAKIFAPNNSPSPTIQRYDAVEPLVQKIFVIDTKTTETRISCELSEEESDPRYLSQPIATTTMEPALSVSEACMDIAESSSYHEIDSFFVSSSVDLRIATMV